jgi:hypothetical protein
MNSFGTDKATGIRYPSTAQLFIDSNDRNLVVLDASGVTQNAYDFIIVKKQSLVQGFFNRIGTTEVVLEWCGLNIDPIYDNTEYFLDVSGVAVKVDIPPGNYTVSEVLDAMVLDLSGQGLQAKITKQGSSVFLQALNFAYNLGGAKSTFNLNQQIPGEPVSSTFYFFEPCADIRPYRYIDFVCEQLTYAQDVKDASTSNFSRDTLCRWYFDDDVPEALDKYGFPIFMGYKPFRRRRLYNPPKQIKYDNNLPVSSLRFQLYGTSTLNVFNPPTEPIPKDVGQSNWCMTLQLSEN